ncbi:MAG: DNA-binding protein [Elusimicrobia bacterium]|nr:DNA-binding protein [Candidatus Liberimonas magnetica]
MYIETKVKRNFMGRFNYGDDLLDKLNSFCKEHGIKIGAVQVIGAVQKAKMGYYSQSEKKYTGCVELDKKLEIASCIGNVSLKDEKVFVHAHIVLADYDGKAFGGHLMPGTIVFAAEFFIQEMEGEALKRVPDPSTGLPLWK